MEVRSSTFQFLSYKFEPDKKRIIFNYKIIFSTGSSLLFTEKIIFPKRPNLKNIPQKLLKKILQAIHLALGISYYKLYCCPKIKLKYVLTQEEAIFWESFYVNGLGEFFYKNKLNPSIFPGFPFDKNKKSENYRITRNQKFLVGIGGGKDSIVAVELLKKHKLNFSTFLVETQKELSLINNLTKEFGAKNLKIKRILDDKVFDKNIGYFGHIPISGIYAFLGVLAALFYNYSYFVVANEFSSDFGNIKYRGKIINHQWSKSSEFEKIFQNYLKNYLSPDLFYFSLLRPFYEIRVAEMFSALEKYFPLFSSCNNNFKINQEKIFSGLWCGKCPKCVFTFLILSPFLPKDTLINIFGKNLFQDPDILINLRDILGFGKRKPFDCVGTPQEAKAAFYLARDKFKDDLAGEIFLPKIDPEDNRFLFDYQKMPIKIYFYSKKNPHELIKEVFRSYQSSVPDYIKFLGMKNALIVGYGIEGRATENYLKKFFPDLKIAITDIKNSDNYLEEQERYDIAIRSPGVAKKNLKIPYTTATNIFFSYVKSIPGVKIIGVTGTKGKSTTASLIHHILKKAGKRVELWGNIGKPMLSAIIGGVKKNTIFVLELSSYQLDDIKYSPDIAVVTSLFPDHIDYHQNIKSYYEAKKNIIKYQQPQDFFVFNPQNKIMRALAKKTKAKAFPFISKDFLGGLKIPLLGKHNHDNIRAAIAAVKCLGVSDRKIKKAIESFKPLPHRLEFVGEFKGIKFFDDAISTTPESTIAAIKSLPKIGTIFLGGQDRGYNFSELRRVIKKFKIKNIVLFPDSGLKIIKNKKGLNVLETKSMEEAVNFAYRYTKEGEVCLLSCASPSYSLWKNFEEKGNQFKFWVKKLAES